MWRTELNLLRPAGPASDYQGGRIERVDPRTGAVTVLYDHCGPHKLLGPNDIVFDGVGGFYFTDLGKARARDRDWGGVYYALRGWVGNHRGRAPCSYPKWNRPGAGR